MDTNNGQQKGKFDISPLLFDAMCNNKFLWTYIDKFYEEHFDEIMMAEKVYNEQTLQYQHGSLKHDIICNKLMGIYNLENKSDIICAFIMVGWNKTYNHFRKFNEKINYDDFINHIKIISKTKNDDIYFDNIAVSLFILNMLNMSVDFSDEVQKNEYEKIISALYDFTKIPYNLKNILKETKHKSMPVRKEYFPNKAKIFGEDISAFTKKHIDKKAEHTLFSLDDVGSCHLETTFDDIFLTREEVDDIISCWIIENESVNSKDFNLYLAIALRIRILQKAFNENKLFFMANFDDNLKEDRKDKALINVLQNDIASYKNQLKSAKAENERLKTEYKSSLEQENINLQKEIVKLKKELEEQKEIISDYELLLDQTTQEEKLMPANIDYSYDDISQFKVAIVGGRPAIISELGKIIKFTHISEDDKTSSLSNLKNMDIIFFKTNFLSHTLFYKSSSIAKRNDIPIRYIQSDNKGKMLEEIKCGLLSL